MKTSSNFPLQISHRKSDAKTIGFVHFAEIAKRHENFSWKCEFPFAVVV